MYAAQLGSVEKAKALLAAGADPLAKDSVRASASAAANADHYDDKACQRRSFGPLALDAVSTPAIHAHGLRP